MRLRKVSPDVLAILALLLLWGIFFWRLFTPIAADQASFKQGDFSGQFVAFGAYQYERFSQGEIPLWNPYNNGGLPFIADTQAAVFYPPRLLTIAFSSLAGGWSYNSLQIEAVLHVLLYSLLMYGFVRRLTLNQAGSVYGAWIAAVIVAYGGFVAGYPPLQLALLESAIWLPLAMLGILEATRNERIRWFWLLLAGFATGLSWLAGHPQTAWFLTYVLIAWLAYRCTIQKYSLRVFVIALFITGFVTLGVCAVTFLPGVEYLILASRSDLGFDAKGNGFPMQDILQFVFPGSVSVFSPLYVGIPALLLAGIALWRRVPGSLFWFSVFVVGLIHSFGANTAWYYAIYNFLPGLRFFRGQERAAFLVANSLAILAGLGAVYLVSWQLPAKMLRRVFQAFIGLLFLVSLLIVVGWMGDVGERFGQMVSIAVFSSIVAGIAYVLITQQMHRSRNWLMIALCLLIAFELFTVNQDAESTYDAIPFAEQLSMTPPTIVQQVLNDDSGEVFRVDGFRGLRANYGSLYSVMDMRGISPLFLRSAQSVIYRDYVNNPLAWELFAVKYIFSERESFGSVDTDVIAQGSDDEGVVYLHEIQNPRPFAHLVYDVAIVDSDAFAGALLDDPRFTPRDTLILNSDPGLNLPDSPADDSSIMVTDFSPESFTIEIETSEDAILSLAHVDYPGWIAKLDEEPVDILRAYGALTAIAIPAGEHTLRLVYDPPLYRIGAIFSLVTWASLIIVGGMLLLRKRNDT